MLGKGQCKICDIKIMTWNFPYRPWYQPSTHISPPTSLSGLVYLRQKNEFGQNPEENIIFIGPGQYYTFIACWWRKYENVFTQEYHIPCGQHPRLWHEIFHIVPGINPRLISALQLRCRAWFRSLGLMPGPIWKMSYQKMSICTMTLETVCKVDTRRWHLNGNSYSTRRIHLS
jgi:hypothetical protein